MDADPHVRELARSLLHRAAELVGHGWAQRAEARAEDGRAVDPWEPNARAWSLLGALVASVEEHDRGRSELPLEALAVALTSLAAFVDEDSMARWNDRELRKQDDVVGALRAAAVRV